MTFEEDVDVESYRERELAEAERYDDDGAALRGVVGSDDAGPWVRGLI